MVIIIRGTSLNHNKAAHTTAFLAGVNAIKNARKTLVLQFCQSVPVEDLLVGKKMMETDIKNTGFMFEDDGIDALCRRLTKERLQKEVFDSCTTAILNSENMLDIAGMSTKENFEEELLTHPEDISSLIEQSAAFYDDVFVYMNGKNEALCKKTKEVLKEAEIPFETFICIRQGRKEDEVDDKDTNFIITGYDSNSTFDAKYLKTLYKTKRFYSIPYNTEYKDAYNNGTLMNYIGKNEKIGEDDISYPIMTAALELLKAGLEHAEPKKEEVETDPIEIPEETLELSECEEPSVEYIKGKGLFAKDELVLLEDDEEFHGEIPDECSDESEDDEIESESVEETEEEEFEFEEEKPRKKKKRLFGFGKKKTEESFDEDENDDDDDDDLSDNIITEAERITAPSPDEWACPECGTVNIKKFCSECGERKPEPEPEAEPVSDEWICPECGEVNPAKAKFCLECGAKKPEEPKPWICPECGEENPVNAKFCLECGTKKPQ